ncbi:hypothetical protein Emag_001882 [Eimeria magna]
MSKEGPRTGGGPPRRRGPLNRRVRLRRRLLGTSIRPLSPHPTRGAVPDKSPLSAATAAVTPLSGQVALLQQGVCPSRLERLLQQQLQRQQQERREKRREKQQQLETLRLQQTQQLHALQQRFDFASAAAAAAGESQQRQQQQQQSFSPVAEAAALAAAGLLARLRASRRGLQSDHLSPRSQQGAQYQLLSAPFLRLCRGPTIECSSSSRESSRDLDGNRRRLDEEEQTKNCPNVSRVERDNRESPSGSLRGIAAASVSQLQRCFLAESSSDEDRPSACPATLNISSGSSSVNSSSSKSSSKSKTEDRGIQVSVQLSSWPEKHEDLAVSSLSSFNPLSAGAGHSRVLAEAAAVSLGETDNSEKKEPQIWREQGETAESIQGQEAHAASLHVHRGSESVELFKRDTLSEEEKDNCTKRLQAPVAALHAAAAEASSTYLEGGRKEERRHLSLLAASTAAATAVTSIARAAAGATAAEAAAREIEPSAAAAAATAGGEAAIQTRGVPLVLVMREKYPKWRRLKPSKIESEELPLVPAQSDPSLPLLLGRERVSPRAFPSPSAAFLLTAEEKSLEEEPFIASVSGLDACMQSGAVPAQRHHSAGAAVNMKSSRKRRSWHSKALRKEQERGQHADGWRSSLRYREGTSIAADAFQSPPLRDFSYFDNNYDSDVFAEERHAPGRRSGGPQVTIGPQSISTVDSQWSSRGLGANEERMQEGRTCCHEVRVPEFSRRQRLDFLSKSFAAKTSMSSVST